MSLRTLKEFIQAYSLQGFRAKRNRESENFTSTREGSKRVVLSEEALGVVRERVAMLVSKRRILQELKDDFLPSLSLATLKRIMNREGIKYHEKTEDPKLMEAFADFKEQYPMGGSSLLFSTLRQQGHLVTRKDVKALESSLCPPGERKARVIPRINDSSLGPNMCAHMECKTNINIFCVFNNLSSVGCIIT